MKIGRIDVTVPMLVYGVGTVVGLGALVIMWVSHSELRLESYYRNRILLALNGDEPGAGLEACDALLVRYPDKAAVRLLRGNILYRQNQFNEAEEAFAGVTALISATPEEKAWAWVGRGASAFAAGNKDEKAALKAEVYFEDALKEDKECADALVNRALVQLWKKNKEGALEDAEKYSKQASAAAAPPSLEAEGQLYILKGLISMRRSRPEEAAAFFERAKAILPGWKKSDVCQRNSILGAAVDKDTEPIRRRDLLKKCETMASQFGNQARIMNALGVGWSLIKGEPESEQQKVYKSAMQFFERAMSANVKEPLAYLNAAGLKEDLIAEQAEKLSGPVTGLKGETPPINDWLAGETQTLRFAPVDKPILVNISNTLRETEDIWQKYLDRAATKPSEKLEATLWLSACIRRRSYLMESSAELERVNLLNKAFGLIKELAAQNPENQRAQFALAQSLLERGDPTHAYSAYKAAAAKGMNTPALARILKGLDVQVEIVDTRPPKDRRSLGQRPLIGGTLKNAGSLGVIKTVKMVIGDREVAPVLAGMQLLYLPGEKEVFDGDPKVAISVSGIAGAPVNFEPFPIRLNTKPPSWSVEPESGKEFPAGKVSFKVTLAASAGIEFGTLRLALKQVKSGGRSVVLVSEGKCKTKMDDLVPPRKVGHPIDSDAFQVSTGGQDLMPGDWKLEISVLDLNGNALNDAKTYTLK